MKVDPLLIGFSWLDRAFGNETERAFFADISLSIGEKIITKVEDLAAKTVRDHLRGCAYQLATWFAANWWRLRWEPETAGWYKNVDWRLTHCIAAVGGGYIWPNATFASDGDFCEITMRPSPPGIAFEPVRYLNDFQARITAPELEEKIDQFIEGVLSRQEALGITDDRLSSLWEEVRAERQDPKAARLRKLEAMAGFDPDGAPEKFLRVLTAAERELGVNAVEELAAQYGHSADLRLQAIIGLHPTLTGPQPGGFRASIQSVDPADLDIASNAAPWQQATVLAQRVRARWGLGKKPISDSLLADLLGVQTKVLTGQDTTPAPLPLAFRVQAGNSLDIYLDRPRSTTRRFSVSRLVGDFLHFPGGEKLIPATKAKTSRQKFQRAFAQEFLCPIDALLEKVQTDRPDEYDYSAAAHHFGVSPRMIATTLVNHGKLDREALAYIE